MFPEQPRIQKRDFTLIDQNLAKNPKHGKAAKSIKRNNSLVEDKSSKFFTDMGFQRYHLHPDYLVYSSCYKQPPFSSYCKFIAEARFSQDLKS